MRFRGAPAHRHRMRGAGARRGASLGRYGQEGPAHGHPRAPEKLTDVTVIDWLLDSDPSIRWQVMRDLTHEPADVIAAERSRVATEGWGARLLALQTPDGLWAGNAFSQDRTDTFHVLELLRRLGLDPESEQAQRAIGLVREHVTWGDGAWWRPTLGRQSLLRGRGRAVHQRQCRRDRLVLRRRHDAARRPAPRRTAPGWWLELRGRERRDRVIVRDDDQRPRGSARVRAGDRRLGQGGGGTPSRRGVHARAPAVPAEVDRRGDRPQLARILVPDLVALRRPARARLPARRRGRAGRAHRRGDRGRRGQPGCRRPLAAPERP